jgi:hypothetical protein
MLLNLVVRLQMIGATALISLFAFMMSTATILTYFLYVGGGVKIPAN